MKMKTLAALLLCAAMTLSGCAIGSTSTKSADAGSTSPKVETVEAVSGPENGEGEAAAIEPVAAGTSEENPGSEAGAVSGEEVAEESGAVSAESLAEAAPADPRSWEGTNIIYESEHGFRLELPESWTDRYNVESEESGDSFYCSYVQEPGYSGWLFSILYGDGAQYADDFKVKVLPPLEDGTQFYVLYPLAQTHSDEADKAAEYASMAKDVDAIVTTFADINAPLENEVTPGENGDSSAETSSGTSAGDIGTTGSGSSADTAGSGSSAGTSGSSYIEPGAVSGSSYTGSSQGTGSYDGTSSGSAGYDYSNYQEPAKVWYNNRVIAGVMGFTGLESKPARNYDDGTYFYESYITSNGITTTFINQAVATWEMEEQGLELAKAVLDKLYADSIRDVTVSKSAAYSAQFTYPAYYASFLKGENEDTCMVKALMVETDGFFLIYSVKAPADWFDQEIADIAMSNLYVKESNEAEEAAESDESNGTEEAADLDEASDVYE